MFNLEFEILKFEISAIKNAIELTLNLSANVVDDSNDETNFPQNFLVTDEQVLALRKAFTNFSPANINLSKTQLPKMAQLRGFLGKLFGPLIKVGWSLKKNLLT